MCVCVFEDVGIKMMKETTHSPQSHTSNYSLVFSGFGPEVNILSRLLLYMCVCVCFWPPNVVEIEKPLLQVNP